MGSGRLPGKTMVDLDGRPLLWHLINRLRQTSGIDEISVATSILKENDVIENFCKSEKLFCYRGSEEDVLTRTLESLEAHDADVGVIVYGDNPLVDPVVVDEVIDFYKVNREYDWVGNDLLTTFPAGMEVEVFDVEALLDSSNRETDPSIREHGTLHIRQNPKTYSLWNIEAEGVRRRPDLHLGVDVGEDLEVVRMIMKHFSNGAVFRLEDIIEYLDQNPQLPLRNRNVHRRWRKYRQSL
jgi:spore coat polysaccharide biosynthesis protein SpsF (cytidylyltransferase family)